MTTYSTKLHKAHSEQLRQARATKEALMQQWVKLSKEIEDVNRVIDSCEREIATIGSYLDVAEFSLSTQDVREGQSEAA